MEAEAIKEIITATIRSRNNCLATFIFSFLD